MHISKLKEGMTVKFKVPNSWKNEDLDTDDDGWAEGVVSRDPVKDEGGYWWVGINSKANGCPAYVHAEDSPGYYNAVFKEPDPTIPCGSWVRFKLHKHHHWASDKLGTRKLIKDDAGFSCGYVTCSGPGWVGIDTQATDKFYAFVHVVFPNDGEVEVLK